MVLPHGHTLAAGGTLTATIQDRRPTAPLPIWLFVVGANTGFRAVVLAGGGLRGGAEPPTSSGPAVLRLDTVAVLPLAVAASSPIGDDRIGFFIAGLRDHDLPRPDDGVRAQQQSVLLRHTPRELTRRQAGCAGVPAEAGTCCFAEQAAGLLRQVATEDEQTILQIAHRISQQHRNAL